VQTWVHGGDNCKGVVGRGLRVGERTYVLVVGMWWGIRRAKVAVREWGRKERLGLMVAWRGKSGCPDKGSVYGPMWSHGEPIHIIP
jgi:hypothetical protein